jgi:hypothetical protein
MERQFIFKKFDLAQLADGLMHGIVSAQMSAVIGAESGIGPQVR